MAVTVDWTEVEPVAEEAFCIWSGNPEREWARQAWAQLKSAGLTSADTALDRVRAYVRFMVLASFYRDWCAIVWDEVHDDSPEVWLSAVDVDRLHIGQLLGPDDELDIEDDLEQGLTILMSRERNAVVTTLLDGFGGVPLLFSRSMAQQP